MICLVVRVFATFLSTLGTSFDLKEKIFICIAWIPKATVQVRRLHFYYAESCANTQTDDLGRTALFKPVNDSPRNKRKFPRGKPAERGEPKLKRIC